MHRARTSYAALAAVWLALAGAAAAGVERGPVAGGPAVLAFASDRDGDSELYLIRADGRGLRKLTSNRAGDYGPAWSPDGRRIAFASNRRGDDDVYVIGADGRGLKRLTRHPGHEFSPAWSPDGRWIAFVRLTRAGATVLVMDADGGAVTRLSPKPVRGYGSYSPDWSPDGRLIVFSSSHATPENGELYAARPDGTGLRRLTDTKGGVHVLGDDGTPSFSPDGRRIAFGSNRTNDNELWLMNANGTRQHRLAGVPRADDGDPGWSADGSRLAFTSRTAGGAWVYVVGADGTGLRRLTAGAEPAWRPEAG
jgi:TolB protein